MFLLLNSFIFFKRNYCKHLFSLLNIFSFQMSGRIGLKLLAGGLTVWTLVFIVTPNVNTLDLSSFVPKAYCIRTIYQKGQCGQCHESFDFRFFSLNFFPQAPESLIIQLASFRFFSKISEDIRNSRCTTGIVFVDRHIFLLDLTNNSVEIKFEKTYYLNIFHLNHQRCRCRVGDRDSAPYVSKSSGIIE